LGRTLLISVWPHLFRIAFSLFRLFFNKLINRWLLTAMPSEHSSARNLAKSLRKAPPEAFIPDLAGTIELARELARAAADESGNSKAGGNASNVCRFVAGYSKTFAQIEQIGSVGASIAFSLSD